MKDKIQIVIASLDDVISLISNKKTDYNIISIRTPGEEDQIEQLFQLYKDNYASVLPITFDDIEYEAEHMTPPAKEHIKEILDWSKGKSDLLVHCRAGISRSSAVAYLIGCLDSSPKEAIKVLDPLLHWPNKLMVELGAEVLRNPDILETYLDTFYRNF